MDIAMQTPVKASEHLGLPSKPVLEMALDLELFKREVGECLS